MLARYSTVMKGAGACSTSFEVAALKRAVPGAQHLGVSVAVGDDLGLDVAWLVEEPFSIAFTAAKGLRCLAHSRIEEFAHLFTSARDLRARRSRRRP